MGYQGTGRLNPQTNATFIRKMIVYVNIMRLKLAGISSDATDTVTMLWCYISPYFAHNHFQHAGAMTEPRLSQFTHPQLSTAKYKSIQVRTALLCFCYDISLLIKPTVTLLQIW